jgi:alanyl-tRNA synthetase
VVSSISRVLSAPAAELAASAERLLAEGRSLQKQVKRQAEELAGYRASEYSAAAETIGTLRGVLRAELDLDASGIKALAQAIVRGPGLVVVLVGAGDPAAVVAARSADVSWDAGAWVKDAAARFGGRGGGRPELAQGGLPASAEAILADARSRLA